MIELSLTTIIAIIILIYVFRGIIKKFGTATEEVGTHLISSAVIGSEMVESTVAVNAIEAKLEQHQRIEKVKTTLGNNSLTNPITFYNSIK